MSSGISASELVMRELKSNKYSKRFSISRVENIAWESILFQTKCDRSKAPKPAKFKDFDYEMILFTRS